MKHTPRQIFKSVLDIASKANKWHKHISDDISDISKYGNTQLNNQWLKSQYANASTISPSTPIIDLSLSNVYKWNIGSNTILPTPIVTKPCCTFLIYITQPSVGNYLLTYETYYRFPNNNLYIPKLSTTSNTTDLLIGETNTTGTLATVILHKGVANVT